MTLCHVTSSLFVLLMWTAWPFGAWAISPLTDNELEQTDPSGLQLTDGVNVGPDNLEAPRMSVLVIEDIAGGLNHVSSKVVISIDSTGQPMRQSNVVRQDHPAGQADEEATVSDISDGEIEGALRRAESDLVGLVVNNVHGDNQVDTRINLLINVNRPVLDFPGLETLGSGLSEGRGGAALGHSSVLTEPATGVPRGSPGPNPVLAQPTPIPTQPTLSDAISVLQSLQPQAPEIQADINQLQRLSQQPGFR